jgi:hypothetical protein
VYAYSLFVSPPEGNHEKQAGWTLSQSRSLIGSRTALWNVIRAPVKMLFRETIQALQPSQDMMLKVEG